MFHLDRPMYLLGYLAAQSKVYLIDKVRTWLMCCGKVISMLAILAGCHQIRPNSHAALRNSVCSTHLPLTVAFGEQTTVFGATLVEASLKACHLAFGGERSCCDICSTKAIAVVVPRLFLSRICSKQGSWP